MENDSAVFLCSQPKGVSMQQMILLCIRRCFITFGDAPMEQVMHLYIGRCSHETGHAFFTLGDAPMKQVMLLYIKRCFSATGDTSLHQEMLL